MEPIEIQKAELRDFVAGLPEEVREKVKDCIAKIELVICEYGDAGVIALAIVGAVRASMED